jgi:predicted nucleotidyltransferase
MIEKNILEEIKNRLVATYSPEEIYIFGSRANYVEDQETDLEILVVVQDAPPSSRHKFIALGHRSLRGLRVGTIIVVYTKNEFDSTADEIGTLGYEVKHTGKQVYVKA